VSDGIKIVTDASFEQDVLRSDGPVLVDFWAPWCGPCRIVAPVLEKVAERYSGRLTVARMNVDENIQTSTRYGIRSIPTIALFVGGEIADGVVGAAPLSVFAGMLDRHLAGVAESS
jgi:thioredoxin 1